MDSYIRIRIDSKTKENFKNAIKTKEPYLVNNKTDGITTVLTRYIYEYISKENVSK